MTQQTERIILALPVTWATTGTVFYLSDLYIATDAQTGARRFVFATGDDCPAELLALLQPEDLAHLNTAAATP